MENIEITREKSFPISEECTKEEVANFICKELKLKDEVKYILINDSKRNFFLTLIQDDIYIYSKYISSNFEVFQ